MTRQYHTWKKRITAFALVFALLFSMIPASMSSAAKKVSLAKKKLTITVGKSKQLKLKNNKKKVSWKVVSGKTKVKLKAKKKTGVTIVAKKKGKAKVQAIVGKKKYTCKVTVVGKSTPTPEDTSIPDPQVSADPDATADVTASGQPSGSTHPGQSSQPDVPTYNPGSSNQPTQNPGSSSQPTQNPGQSSQPTQNPGGNIDLGDKTAFNIGSKRLALGISRDEVLQVIGSATRTEKSPQGFDVIVYNPGGTYNGYTLIYLKDNVVVSLCAVGSAGTVSYGNLVKTGDEASTLAGTSGWSGESWFAATQDGKTKEGEGAYKYTASNPNATVFAYVDYYKKNQVYCIQAYSNTLKKDQMIYPAECNYTTEILNAVKLETAELLMAYRIACGYSASEYPLKPVDGLAAAAKQYLDSCPKGSDNPPDQQNSDKMKAQVLAQNGHDVPMHFAQITMAGSSDSIGFANSVLEQKTASDYIIKLSYTKQRPNGTYYKYWYQYFGIAVADDGNHHTYMIIDLVDRWNTTDKNWYGDGDDDEGWE